VLPIKILLPLRVAPLLQKTTVFENLREPPLPLPAQHAAPACRGASLRSADQTGRADVVGKRARLEKFFLILGCILFFTRQMPRRISSQRLENTSERLRHREQPISRSAW